MIRRPPRSTLSSSSAASDVYKRQDQKSCTVQLKDTQVRDQRRVLEADDELIAKRGDGSQSGLRKDPAAHGKGLFHAQRTSRFHLTTVDRLDGAAEDLCHIGTGMDRQGQAARPEPWQREDA